MVKEREREGEMNGARDACVTGVLVLAGRPLRNEGVEGTNEKLSFAGFSKRDDRHRKKEARAVPFSSSRLAFVFPCSELAL